jgi:hypothetical protein
VPARNGRLWIRHGFKVFQRQPLALAGLFGLFLFAGFVAMMIPGIGLLLTMATLPLLSLGFMLATHLVLQKKTPTASVFVAPLKLTPERRRSQLLLCLGYAGAMLVVGLLADWIGRRQHARPAEAHCRERRQRGHRQRSHRPAAVLGPGHAWA